jgi:hypothetical protein
MNHLRMRSVQIPHHILTTRTEPWGFIKSSVLYLSVHIELSLRLSFYLKHSFGVYTVGTTAGFPLKIVEALAPQSHRRISQKCPQYHMSSYSTHRRVTGFGHPLNGGLGGYYQGNLPRVPWATTYGPKKPWIRSVLASGKRLRSHTPCTKKRPHHSRLNRRGHQPKKN